MSKNKKRKPFPKEKYKYYKEGTTIHAVSTYAGKVVKGSARLDPRDEYDEEFGKNLAAAKCNLKVARRRVKSLKSTLEELNTLVYEIQQEADKVSLLYDEACIDLISAKESLQNCIEAHS
jgi:hypothetical protein